MSFLTNTIRSALSFFASVNRTHSAIVPDHSDPHKKSKRLKRSAPHVFENGDDQTAESSTFKKRRLLNDSKNSVRSCTEKVAESVTPRKSLISDSSYAEIDYDGSMSNSSPQQTQLNTDQGMMPPPSTPQAMQRKERNQLRKATRMSLDSGEVASQMTKTSRVARNELPDEYDMEEARRRAAATRLPPNSGIWETGERELFFHLSYRGFEPLLAHSWMIDFPTLPVSVFAHQNQDIPLIECRRSTPFRATKALEELLMTGTKVRDHNLAHQDLRSEPVLEKATKRYITWALQDFGLPVKAASKNSAIPVYAISTMRQGQTTQDVLRSLAIEMHTLAHRHRKALNICPSVEIECALTPPGSLEEETSVHPDSATKILPVIYGIAICRSIMTLFTLNCHAPLPDFVSKHIEQASVSRSKDDEVGLSDIKDDLTATTTNLTDEDTDLGLRYIAAFDFSDGTRDVWNSFVIAIAAIQIRKTMSQALAVKEKLENENLVDESWLSNVDDINETVVMQDHLKSNKAHESGDHIYDPDA